MTRYLVTSWGCYVFSAVPNVERIQSRDLVRLEELMSAAADRMIVVLEGGEDISPALYGQENRTCYAINRSRDAHEVALYKLARKYNVPMLGICRGHQLMAALAGGTLYQDIATEIGRGHFSRHKINFTEAATQLGFVDLMQSNPTGSPDVVNSMHHQAVKDVPDDAIVLARHDDGTAECIAYPWGIGVQHHPEFLRHIEFIDYMFNWRETYAHYTRHNDGGRDRDPERGGTLSGWPALMAKIQDWG